MADWQAFRAASSQEGADEAFGCALRGATLRTSGFFTGGETSAALAALAGAAAADGAVLALEGIAGA